MSYHDRAAKHRDFMAWLRQLGCFTCHRQMGKRGRYKTTVKQLDFHHVHGVKVKDMGQLRGHPNEHVFLGELQKCWILCKRCHNQVHAKRMSLLLKSL